MNMFRGAAIAATVAAGLAGAPVEAAQSSTGNTGTNVLTHGTSGTAMRLLDYGKIGKYHVLMNDLLWTGFDIKQLKIPEGEWAIDCQVPRSHLEQNISPEDLAKVNAIESLLCSMSPEEQAEAQKDVRLQELAAVAKEAIAELWDAMQSEIDKKNWQIALTLWVSAIGFALLLILNLKSISARKNAERERDELIANDQSGKIVKLHT